MASPQRAESESVDTASKADFVTAVPPLDEAQTMAVLKLLVDTHYSGPQAIYHVIDLGFMHSRLSETLEGQNG